MSLVVTHAEFSALYRRARDRWIAYCRRTVAKNDPRRLNIAYAIYDRRTRHLHALKFKRPHLYLVRQPPQP